MKVTIVDKQPGEEDEIIIKCEALSDSLLTLINSFKTGKSKLTFYKDNQIVLLEPKEIYYFESVDDKTFAYTKENVYETKSRIYQLESEMASFDFFRANKGVLVNLNKIGSLAPAFGGRFEALLKNGYKVIISRMYVPALKEKLDL